MRRRSLLWLIVMIVTGLWSGCDDEPEPPNPMALEELGRCAEFNPLRNPYFGDTHVHTTLSLDANVQNTRLTPTDAYRFARGEEVGIQPFGPDGESLRHLQLSRPLDFAVVSDHAEFLGVVSVCATPDLPGYDHVQCRGYRDNPAGAFYTLNILLAAPQEEAQYPDLCGPGGQDCMEPQRAVWAETAAAAWDAYDRSDACTFTSFVGYEWSLNPSTQNIHRNVIFRNHVVPELPTSGFDEPMVEGLWAALRRDCIDVGDGCDVLTIPHNSNLSNGIMFAEVDDAGSPFSAEYAAERELMEPLIEIFQHKGSSECEPNTTLGDELCSFEYLPYATLSGPVLGMRMEAPPQDFVRNVLGRGLAIQEDLDGANPFHYGFIGSTDTHLATPGVVSELGYPGHGGAGGNNAEGLAPGLPDIVEFNPGGLAVLWAEENSREALFLAMRRREAYGTSGPRIILRFFGGWGYDLTMCDDHDFAQVGYDDGVPMGATLPPRQDDGALPTFAVSALRDPDTSGEGMPLQRIQIIKGWLDADADGAFTTEVHDVAGDADNGAAVDLSTCEPAGDGFDSLCAVWRDIDFDPSEQAFYYVRVLENPRCRWATVQCNAGGVDCDEPSTVTEGFEGCCIDSWERTIQERAWSSPIWFTP